LTALAACGDREPDGEPTLDERLDALAECTPTDIQVLLPWTGPAFDPATGQLIEPLPDGHVEAVVNGWRRYTDEAQALRVQHGTAVANDVFARDGLLGFQSVESAECDISISHTLWRDQEAMMGFVFGPAHAAAMAAADEMHHEAKGAYWTSQARDIAPTWQEGIARYVQEAR
jgi:hypothetical protein